MLAKFGKALITIAEALAAAAAVFLAVWLAIKAVLRWAVYSSKLPEWLHACGLGIKQDPQ
ncbi:MAG: hypothetical protein ACRDRX_21025 [Pseudonocardiaceae bacterium]